MKPAPDESTGASKRPKRRVRPGDLGGLRRLVWRSLTAAEEALEAALEEGDREGVLKATHAISTAGGTYMKVVEAVDILPQYRELVEWMEQEKARTSSRGRWAA